MEPIKDLECVFCGKEQVTETDVGTLECLYCKRVYEKGTTKEEAKRLKKEWLEMDRQFFKRFCWGLTRRR